MAVLRSFVAIVFCTVLASNLASNGFGQEPVEVDKELQAKRDQMRIKVQKICPVTGNELGTHGDPIKVKIGKQKMFLCCQGCSSGKIDPKHWGTIHANFAKAQGICPVMKHKLPAKPKYTIVDGQLFYVCCEPCTKKIEAEPVKYLAALDALHKTAIDGTPKTGSAMPSLK